MTNQPRHLKVFDSAGVQSRFQLSSEGNEIARDGSVAWRTRQKERPLRVLVADDNRDAADSLSMLIKIWGHSAWVAYGGATAIEIASKVQLDVFLLDISMPKVDGLTVARFLRREVRFHDALLIAVTGWSDQSHCLLCSEAGFDSYLIKPADPRTLEFLLAIEKRRLSQVAKVPSNSSLLARSSSLYALEANLIQVP
jgi:CheY-like chemotaxis protein